MRSLPRPVVLACAAALAAPALADVTRYDVATSILSIPSVRVGSATFTGVTLLNVGDYTFSLQAATAQVPATPAVASFDAASGLVTLPAVQVGASTYLDVTLSHAGNYVFTLAGATLLPQATLDEIKAFLAAVDARWAGTVPDAATRMADLDACYLNGGRTHAWALQDLQANAAEVAARDAYRVGQVSSNVVVLGLRNLANPDQSTRTEADVQYDVTYADGSVAQAVTTTLIQGSSAGSPGCTVPQTGSDWRFYGNRQLVEATLQARNSRDERYIIASGAAATTPLNYRRDIRFVVTDPLANATYVVIEGPGPAATSDASALPFSLKLVSPHVMRAAPEFAGKTGNFLNWNDDDTFRMCRVDGTGVPAAPLADCTGLGASGDNVGTTSPTADAAADAAFAAQGFVAGGTYLVSVYADDGWKSVNGQAGRTPIAVYGVTLEVLPYTFVEMGGTGPGSDAFPRLSFGATTPAQVQADVVAASPTPLAASWAAVGALADDAAVRLFDLGEYFQGPKSGNAGGAGYPGYRLYVPSYPGSTALALSPLPVTPKLATMSKKSYAEFSVTLSDRNQRRIRSVVSFN